MDVEIIFQYFDRKVNEQRVGDIIDRYRYLLPSWLRILTVGICDAPPEQIEGMLVWSAGRPEYGYASIDMVCKWLDVSERDQRQHILHEMLHIAHRREYNFVQDRLLNPMEKSNEELHKFLVEDYRERNEEFIEGLACAILKGESNGQAADA